MAEKKAHTRKSPQQHAEERLGVAQRRVDKLVAAKARAEEEVKTITAELAEAVRRRDYLAGDPALPLDRDVVDAEIVDDER